MKNKLHLSILGLQPEPVLPKNKTQAAQLPNQEQIWQEQIWHWPPPEFKGGAFAEALRSRRRKRIVERLAAPGNEACRDDPETRLLARFAPEMPTRGTAAFALQADLSVDPLLRAALAACPDIVAVSQAEPVHMQAGTDNAVLMGPRFLGIEPSEWAALHTDLNQWLQADGIQLFSAASGRCYLGYTALALERLGTVDLPPLGCALNRPIGQLLMGASLRPLRRWLTELQMWLYTHPVNAERAKKARPEINSLWVWGRSPWVVSANIETAVISSPAAGRITPRQNDPRPLIYTDSAVLAGVLRAYHARDAGSPAVILCANHLPDCTELAAHGVLSTHPLRVIWSEPLWCYLEGDVSGWRESLEAVDRFLTRIQSACAHVPARHLEVDNGEDLVWQHRHWLGALHRRLFRWE